MNFKKIWTQIASKAEMDSAFKKRLLHNPSAVFKESGVEIPPGVTVKIHEDSDREIHFVLPHPLSDVDLRQASGGFGKNYPYF